MNSFDDILNSNHVDFEIVTTERPGVEIGFSSDEQKSEFLGGSSSSEKRPAAERSMAHVVARSKTERQRRRMDRPQRSSSPEEVGEIVTRTARETADTVAGRVTEELGSKVAEVKGTTEAIAGRADSVVGKAEDMATRVAEVAGKVEGSVESAVDRTMGATRAVVHEVVHPEDPTEKSRGWLGRKTQVVKGFSKKIQESSILTVGLVGSAFISNPDSKHALIAGAVAAAVGAVTSEKLIKRQAERKNHVLKPEESKQQ